jgi:predicted RNase H-like HicB family nuclease
VHDVRTYNVRAEWDPEAEVWYVAESDVPGLATEADSVDNLIRKLRVMIPEMLELNGIIQDHRAHVPFSLMAHVEGAASHC